MMEEIKIRSDNRIPVVPILGGSVLEKGKSLLDCSRSAAARLQYK